MPSKHKAARINQKYDLSYYTSQVATWVVATLQCLNSAGQASLKLCATHSISVHRTVHFMCAVPLTCTLASKQQRYAEKRHISVAQLSSVLNFNGIFVSFVFWFFFWQNGKGGGWKPVRSCLAQDSGSPTDSPSLSESEPTSCCLPRFGGLSCFSRHFRTLPDGWDPYIAKPGGPCSMRTAIWRAWSKVFLSIGTWKSTNRPSNPCLHVLLILLLSATSATKS